MGKSIRSNQKKALRSQRRAQVVTEEAHLATEGRKQEAMAKCMAAPVLEVPLPAPAAVPNEEIDTDENAAPASGRRGRSKKAHRFLLPVPVQMPAEQDEQMQGDDDAKPSSRVRTVQPGKRLGSSGKVIKKRAVVGKFSGGSLQKRVPKFSKSSRKKR